MVADPSQEHGLLWTLVVIQPRLNKPSLLKMIPPQLLLVCLPIPPCSVIIYYRRHRSLLLITVIPMFRFRSMKYAPELMVADPSQERVLLCTLMVIQPRLN